MKRIACAGFVVLCIVLLLFLALFPLLTIDAVSLLLSRAALLDRGNLALLLYLELSRGFTTVVAIVVAAWLVARAARTADGRALALFLIFSALTFEKILGTTPYPGPVQQWLVTTLRNAGVSRATLAWVFGPTPWSLWPAWAAALRFSVVFTTPPLSAASIDESGMRDRRGMLRGSGVAGADIGRAFRAISKRALAAGAFRPLPLWLGAFGLIAITT
ncbi:MAG TPA: hypothetical protein VFO52_09705, partial [Longimicrobiales bacterium]|nr:hypothetical protein [Longimicrobiales bacterium]